VWSRALLLVVALLLFKFEFFKKRNLYYIFVKQTKFTFLCVLTSRPMVFLRRVNFVEPFGLILSCDLSWWNEMILE